MPTTTKPQLTQKQQRVYKMLEQGKLPVDIAKAMKITRSGVYGHIRQMRKLGIEPPGANGHPNGDDPLPALRAINDAGSRAHVAVADARAAVDERMTEINAELKAAQERTAILSSELAQLEDLEAQYTSVLATLNGALSG